MLSIDNLTYNMPTQTQKNIHTLWGTLWGVVLPKAKMHEWERDRERDLVFMS